MLRTCSVKVRWTYIAYSIELDDIIMPLKHVLQEDLTCEPLIALSRILTAENEHFFLGLAKSLFEMRGPMPSRLVCRVSDDTMTQLANPVWERVPPLVSENQLLGLLPCVGRSSYQPQCRGTVHNCNRLSYLWQKEQEQERIGIAFSCARAFVGA